MSYIEDDFGSKMVFPDLYYYMQDELGSPLRVSGYRKKEGSFIGRSEYLTYGYDEFGNDLGRELEEEGIPNPYDRQGVEQPFGYTGQAIWQVNLPNSMDHYPLVMQ